MICGNMYVQLENDRRVTKKIGKIYLRTEDDNSFVMYMILGKDVKFKYYMCYYIASVKAYKRTNTEKYVDIDAVRRECEYFIQNFQNIVIDEMDIVMETEITKRVCSPLPFELNEIPAENVEHWYTKNRLLNNKLEPVMFDLTDKRQNLIPVRKSELQIGKVYLNYRGDSSYVYLGYRNDQYMFLVNALSYSGKEEIILDTVSVYDLRQTSKPKVYEISSYPLYILPERMSIMLQKLNNKIFKIVG